MPVALVTFAAAALIIAGYVVLHGAVSAAANFEGLREAHQNSSSVTLSGALNAVGFVLLLAPLLYLFRAVQARSAQVRGQLIGLVVVAPLFLAVAGILLTIGTQEAANQYARGEANATLSSKDALKECREAQQDKGRKEFAEEFIAAKGNTSLDVCRAEKIEEDKASNAVEDASLVQAGRLVGLAAGLAFVVALFYSCLWAMRTGLLSRFWGSLGMALGVATLIGLTQFTLIWFFYFGLLVAGWVPRGRPPAWAAGEAIPWPTPGEKAAAELQGDGASGEEADSSPGPETPRRKRKQRD